MAAALPALNLADGWFTWLLLQAGVAREANPLMRMALDSSPVAFAAAKLLLVCGGVVLLWRHRRQAMAGVALQVCLAAYSAVVGYHLVFLGSALLHSGSSLP